MGLLIAEKSPTKVAAVFQNESAARETAASVRDAVGLDDAQVRILSPADGKLRHSLFGRKVQPESSGIVRTFWRSHLVLGAIGGAIGLFVWTLWQAHPLIASSPVGSLIALVGFGITFGMLAAGLLTLRPDQAALFTQLRDKLQSGHWGVVFHPTTAEQAEAARQALGRHQATVLTTL